jgi:hypothetical protein
MSGKDDSGTKCSSLRAYIRAKWLWIKLYLYHDTIIDFYFDPEDGGYMFLPERRLTFNGLHDVLCLTC